MSAVGGLSLIEVGSIASMQSIDEEEVGDAQAKN